MPHGKTGSRQEKTITRLMKPQQSGDPTSPDVVSLLKYICSFILVGIIRSEMVNLRKGSYQWRMGLLSNKRNTYK